MILTSFLGVKLCWPIFIASIIRIHDPNVALFITIIYIIVIIFSRMDSDFIITWIERHLPYYMSFVVLVNIDVLGPAAGILF